MSNPGLYNQPNGFGGVFPQTEESLLRGSPLPLSLSNLGSHYCFWAPSSFLLSAGRIPSSSGGSCRGGFFLPERVDHLTRGFIRGGGQGMGCSRQQLANHPALFGINHWACTIIGSCLHCTKLLAHGCSPQTTRSPAVYPNADSSFQAS